MFPPMGNIPQLLGRVILAASVWAGGASVLSAGGAEAATCTPSSSGIFSMTAITFTGTPANATPPCELASLGTLATVDVGWNAGQVDTNGSYRYSISAGSEKFLAFSLNADIAFNQTGTFTKNVYSDPGFTTLIGTATSTDGGSVVFQNLTPQTFSTVYVEDIYAFNGGTQVNSLSNNFRATPGPLPVLGAGAAFGFSRKLRGRIKAARLG